MYLCGELILLEIRCAPVVSVVTPSKPSDEVTNTSVNQQLDLTDSRTDQSVPQGLSNSESATRPQTSSYDESYEPERLYYDAAPPRPPLPNQPPSGMPSD